MGLGKTLQALCVLERRSLVVAPTSVLENWIAEARRFRPELSVSVYHGPERALDERVDVTVTSHALLRIDREILSAVEWDTVVIDESQMIRNPDTELARAAYALKARFRVSLTGTPDRESPRRLVEPDALSQSRLSRRDMRTSNGATCGRSNAVSPSLSIDCESVFGRFSCEGSRVWWHPSFRREPRSRCARSSTRMNDGVYDAVRLAARRDALAALERKGETRSPLWKLCCACDKLRVTRPWCRASMRRRLQKRSFSSKRSRPRLPKGTKRSCSRSGHRCSTCSSRTWRPTASTTSVSMGRLETAPRW